MEDFPKPRFITSECLCGSLKYRVDFPESHDFIKSSGTCQCTQCRKCTGSLFFMVQTTTPSSCFKFIGGTSTLKHYKASSKAQRGFCGECSSLLYWKPMTGDSISIAVGSIDPLHLIGEGADGVNVPKGGFGFALASGGGWHEWCSNEIPGVTDGIRLPGGDKGKRSEGT